MGRLQLHTKTKIKNLSCAGRCEKLLLYSHTYIEHSLLARHWARHWRFDGKKTKQSLWAYNLTHVKGLPCAKSFVFMISSALQKYCITVCVCMKVKVVQSCLTLCDPMGYTVHGILQAKILEWVAIPFSRGSSQPRDQTQVSHITGRFFTI